MYRRHLRGWTTLLLVVALLTPTLGGARTLAGDDRTAPEDTIAWRVDDPGSGPVVGIDQAGMSTALSEALAAEDRNQVERVLDAARVSLEHRERLLGSELAAQMGKQISQQQRNVDVAETLVGIHENRHESAVARTLALALEAGRWQAGSLDLPGAEPVPLAGYQAPSESLLELAARYGVEPSRDQLEDIRELDTLPEAQRDALARFVDAFLALETATRETMEARAGTLRAAQPWTDPVGIEAPLPDAGVDFAPVIATRAQFLQAVGGLHAALPTDTAVASSVCEPLVVAPAFAIDLSTCANTYTVDVGLQLDAGGNDTYHNNAGGSGVTARDPSGLFTDTPCLVLPFPLLDDPPVNYPGRAAALVDLGVGTDQYGPPTWGRGCGANGGGLLGVGILVDGGGDDAYTARQLGTNGGGVAGAGFLLDAGGNDTYSAWGSGTNGGGLLGGVGLLVDGLGDDVYTAGDEGTNGGAYLGSIGILLDGGGEDAYRAGGTGTNGGGAPQGAGFLLDATGNDTYTAGGFGTNGGGAPLGTGFLLDATGNDTYTAGEPGVAGTGSQGTNGGGYFGGAGLLIDGGGGDAYTAGDDGTNGGGSHAYGTGALVDGGGEDLYAAGGNGTNGGGAERAVGQLMDLGGNDTYVAGGNGTNGGGHDEGMGMLFEAAGDDSYTAGGTGTNGGAHGKAVGTLVDLSGDDAYTARGIATNGGASGVPWYHPPRGLLFDGGGSDTYEDDTAGAGTDRTVVPKGTLGAQVDVGAPVGAPTGLPGEAGVGTS